MASAFNAQSDPGVVFKFFSASQSMEIGELVVLALETLIVGFCMKILSVLITVIMYGRMIEIDL